MHDPFHTSNILEFPIYTHQFPLTIEPVGKGWAIPPLAGKVMITVKACKELAAPYFICVHQRSYKGKRYKQGNLRPGHEEKLSSDLYSNDWFVEANCGGLAVVLIQFSK